jgi:hypothetical protein
VNRGFQGIIQGIETISYEQYKIYNKANQPPALVFKIVYLACKDDALTQLQRSRCLSSLSLSLCKCRSEGVPEIIHKEAKS